MNRPDILIIGCGPAGSSVALHLCNEDPAWASRILMIDRATHPRNKLCGGAVSYLGLSVLDSLNLRDPTNAIDADTAIIRLADINLIIKGTPVARVVRRSDFDAWLVRECQSRGIAISQGEELRHLEVTPKHVEVTTSKQTYHAGIVVGADGATGATRRFIQSHSRQSLCRLVEVLTPPSPDANWAFHHRALFTDFSPMSRGIQGYYWDFPSIVQGKPMMNRGLFDSRAISARKPVSMTKELARHLEARGIHLDDCRLEGHPIRPLDLRGKLSNSRLLLVGDAAGTDPMIGEGISFALGYGAPAARTIIDAFERNDYTLANYLGFLRRTPLFRHLAFRVRLSRLSYRVRNLNLLRWNWKALGAIAPWLYRFDRHFMGCTPPSIQTVKVRTPYQSDSIEQLLSDYSGNSHSR